MFVTVNATLHAWRRKRAAATGALKQEDEQILNGAEHPIFVIPKMLDDPTIDKNNHNKPQQLKRIEELLSLALPGARVRFN